MFAHPQKLSTEKQCLAALTKFPEIFPNIDGIIKENFFSNKLHQIVFGIVRSSLAESQPLDKFTISNKIKGFQLNFEVDPFEYLEALESIQINKEVAVSYFQELAKIYGIEKIYKQTEEIQKYLKNNTNQPFNEIISKSDSLYGEVINSFNLDGEPEDVFDGLSDYIEELGEKETDEIKIPFPRFQQYYGGLEPGTLTLFVAGYKVGKSWFLLNLLKRICTENENVEGLYVDSEMTTNEVRRRLTAELAKINEYYLRHGWRKNPELCEKVRAVWSKVEKWFGCMQHLYVGNIGQYETESIIRRWVWKKRAANPNMRPVIVYDYFKIHSGDGDINDGFSSSMVLGRKVDGLKKLAQDLQVPIVAAAQSNAEGNIGLSREIGKFVDSAHKLKLRTTEDIEEEGGFATHKIEPICCRSLGPEIKPFNDKVKISKDKDGRIIYKENAILYKFADFSVQELNTLQEQMDLRIGKKIKKDNQELL